MKLIRACLAFVVIALLFCGCAALAEVDILGLSEEELISLRDLIDAKLADIHTETSEMDENFIDAPLESSLGDNEISINETTFVDGFECSIKEINWYSSSDFDFDVINKEKGFEYIVIVLSEKNTTGDTENAPMFNMLSADGQQCNTQPVLGLYKNQYKINFGATMANTTAYAYFIYKIPSDSERFKLQIMTNGFGENSEYIVFYRNDIK